MEGCVPRGDVVQRAYGVNHDRGTSLECGSRSCDRHGMAPLHQGDASTGAVSGLQEGLLRGSQCKSAELVGGMTQVTLYRDARRRTWSHAQCRGTTHRTRARCQQ